MRLYWSDRARNSSCPMKSSRRSTEPNDAAAVDRDLDRSSPPQSAAIVGRGGTEDKGHASRKGATFAPICASLPMAAEIYQPAPAMGGDGLNFDPEVVRAFEHAGWQQAAVRYDANFARASMQFVEPLLDAAGVAGGTQVLDLCCGTGLVAAAAARRGAVPIGVDFSSAMLAEA